MNKACPVVLRYNNNNLELLALKHPKSGPQLAKGGIKKGEQLEQACIRELKEESGIDAIVVRNLGTWKSNYKNQVWEFCLMHYEGILPDTWDFETKDDGGHTFSFFWQPIDKTPHNDWRKASKGAFEFIKNALNN